MNPLESWAFAGLAIGSACWLVVLVARAITPRPRYVHAHRMTRLERAEMEMEARRDRTS